ncbi:MAG TPA: helix-turn-helix domain-containing protein [Ktedonobacteraceae bacterium]|nr:helix-turn-helix domain-containing protein [Ktedonobacteraceae bacterium]
MEWLTLQQIADELQLHIETVREWVRTKRLAAYKVGRDYRVKRTDLDKFLEERRTKPDNEA